MVTPIPLFEGRREGGYGICFSVPGKWRSLRQSLDVNGKGMTMANGLPLPEGVGESGHGLCPSPPVKWRSVVMVTLIPLPEGRMEGGYGICFSLFLGSGGVFAKS